MKRFNFIKAFLIMGLILVFVAPAFAETPSTLKKNVWKADQVFKQGADFDGQMDLTNTTITATGKITGTHIADITREFDIPLAALFINGVGPMGYDSVTAPGLATTDGIPKVIYATSAETTSIGYSFTVPEIYSTDLAFRVMVSVGDTYASKSIDWQIWVNKEGTGTTSAFDAAPYEQTAVSPTTECTASNAFLTFTADATALAGIAAGDVVTVWWWNADVTSGTGGTTEIGAIQGMYTATQ